MAVAGKMLERGYSPWLRIAGFSQNYVGMRVGKE